MTMHSLDDRARELTQQRETRIREMEGKLKRIKEYTDPLDSEVAKAVNRIASE